MSMNLDSMSLLPATDQVELSLMGFDMPPSAMMGTVHHRGKLCLGLAQDTLSSRGIVAGSSRRASTVLGVMRVQQVQMQPRRQSDLRRERSQRLLASSHASMGATSGQIVFGPHQARPPDLVQ